MKSPASAGHTKKVASSERLAALTNIRRSLFGHRAAYACCRKVRPTSGHGMGPTAQPWALSRSRYCYCWMYPVGARIPRSRLHAAQKSIRDALQLLLFARPVGTRIQVGARLPTCCGRQGATAFHQFGTLKVQRFGQQFSDRSGLHNERVDLNDFLGGELTPPLRRRAAVDPA